MRRLRKIGETEATLLIEKSLRMDSSIPVARASHARVLNPSEISDLAGRKVLIIILALTRNQLQPPKQSDRSQNRIRTFTTPISAKEEDDEKRAAAEDLILAEPADIEVLADGNFGEIPLDFIRELNDGEGASVE